jgi:hypothetical protein
MQSDHAGERARRKDARVLAPSRGKLHLCHPHPGEVGVDVVRVLDPVRAEQIGDVLFDRRQSLHRPRLPLTVAIPRDGEQRRAVEHHADDAADDGFPPATAVRLVS